MRTVLAAVGGAFALLTLGLATSVVVQKQQDKDAWCPHREWVEVQTEDGPRIHQEPPHGCRDGEDLFE